LLLFIELDRKATGQLFAPMGPWLVVHIIIATILVPWYPMLLYSGGKVSAGKPKTFHKRIAAVFFVLRFLLWVTAVLAMQAKESGCSGIVRILLADLPITSMETGSEP